MTWEFPRLCRGGSNSLDAYLEVAELRFGHREVRRLYDSAGFLAPRVSA
jgi:hypothetical protein